MLMHLNMIKNTSAITVLFILPETTLKCSSGNKKKQKQKLQTVK